MRVCQRGWRGVKTVAPTVLYGHADDVRDDTLRESAPGGRDCSSIPNCCFLPSCAVKSFLSPDCETTWNSSRDMIGRIGQGAVVGSDGAFLGSRRVSGPKAEDSCRSPGRWQQQRRQPRCGRESSTTLQRASRVARNSLSGPRGVRASDGRVIGGEVHLRFGPAALQQPEPRDANDAALRHDRYGHSEASPRNA